ncbi:peptidoglycan D,D-transpeptidase FtsI family protein [Metabacillus iocasae]|uniref:peptidoglycan D,D-transpeptidase FtsI family protein n=1 Tax=Priestia iocasae TaxID=2291674 RepID=UPI0019648C7D|nr:penicillin-binding protein 2 [Metabacillus iocasae]
MKKKKKRRTHVPFRLNLLFFIVFLLFSVLILRLGLVQIVYGENFQREVEKTEDVTINTPVPRGRIYDRYNRVIVDNAPLNAITYTRFQGTDAEERLEVAKRLANLMTIPLSAEFIDIKGSDDREVRQQEVRLTERDLKDYWIMTRPEKAEKKITAEDRQLLKEGEITDKEVYDRQLERITKKDLLELKEEVKVIAIKRQMEAGYALTPQIIKSGVTKEEFAIVSENLEQLPGVDTTTYWERYYPEDRTLRTLLGNVSSANEGLPRDRIDYYLSRGYNRNDRVGTSYLEKQYEDVLSGQKAQVKHVTSKSGSLLETIQVSEGNRGSDLVLTVDMELQKEVEKVLEEELLQTKRKAGTQYLDRAFVVMMDPRTGEILTMAGKQYTIDQETGKPKVDDFALGNISSSYTMGSVVKGATILAGFDSGAISPGDVFVDQPLKFAGTKEKKSVRNFGPINDLTALQRSSNVYMFRTVMEMANVKYRLNGTLPIKSSTFAQLRSYYSQFGLGISTGIDLDNESTGFQGGSDIPGTALDLAIGQYDTYTPLQLVQYVATIANGGYRVKPQIVKEVREPTIREDEIGNVQHSFEPEILNKVTMSKDEIERVQEGFRRVMQTQNGTAYSAFANASYKPAGKTGTAEAFVSSKVKGAKPIEVRNSTLVGYAPYDNPEIAFAVVVPSAYTPNSSHSMSRDLGKAALDAYFDLKEKGEEEVAEKEAQEEVQEQE